MLKKSWIFLRNRVPLVRRITRLPGQLLHLNPFAGDVRPARVPLVAACCDETTSMLDRTAVWFVLMMCSQNKKK